MVRYCSAGSCLVMSDIIWRGKARKYSKGRKNASTSRDICSDCMKFDPRDMGDYH